MWWILQVLEIATCWQCHVKLKGDICKFCLLLNVEQAVAIVTWQGLQQLSWLTGQEAKIYCLCSTTSWRHLKAAVSRYHKVRMRRACLIKCWVLTASVEAGKLGTAPTELNNDVWYWTCIISSRLVSKQLLIAAVGGYIARAKNISSWFKGQTRFISGFHGSL